MHLLTLTLNYALLRSERAVRQQACRQRRVRVLAVGLALVLLGSGCDGPSAPSPGESTKGSADGTQPPPSSTTGRGDLDHAEGGPGGEEGLPSHQGRSSNGGVPVPFPTQGVFIYENDGKVVYGATRGEIDDHRFLQVASSRKGDWRFHASDDREIRVWDINVTSEGTRLVALTLKNRSMELQFTPPEAPLDMPSTVVVGTEWGYELISDDGCVRHSATREVTAIRGGDGTNGQRRWDIHESSELLNHTDAEGCTPVEIFSTREFQYSPETGLIVSEHESSEGTISRIPFKVDRTSTLTSGPGVTGNVEQ